MWTFYPTLPKPVFQKTLDTHVRKDGLPPGGTIFHIFSRVLWRICHWKVQQQVHIMKFEQRFKCLAQGSQEMDLVGFAFPSLFRRM